MNFRDKLYRWMYGRNGLDQLSFAIMILYFILTVINSFMGSVLMHFFNTLILVYAFFRVFSKNLPRRHIENQWFNRYYLRVHGKARLQGRKLKDIKTHRYRRCPNCKTVMRVPRQTGKHTVVCPRCFHETKVNIWF